MEEDEIIIIVGRLTLSALLFIPAVSTYCTGRAWRWLPFYTPKNKSQADPQGSLHPQKPWQGHQAQELILLVDQAVLLHNRLDWASLWSYRKEGLCNHFIIFNRFTTIWNKCKMSIKFLYNLHGRCYHLSLVYKFCNVWLSLYCSFLWSIVTLWFIIL